jgi:hypothetical protein
MTRDDIRKLLGGYATGTLTPQEQQSLFAAALDDQELFNALANDQALRDLLRDPAARAHVLASLDDRPSAWRRTTAWMFRPAFVGAMLACLAIFGGYEVWQGRQARTASPVLTAAGDLARMTPAPTPSPQAPEAVKSEEPKPPARENRKTAASPATAAAPGRPPDDSSRDTADKVGQALLPNRAPRPAQTQTELSQQSEPRQQQQQAVTVTAEAPILPPAPMKSEFRADTAGSLEQKTAPLVNWSVLRRAADGHLSPIEPDQIQAGDAIVLRLEPYADGFLSLTQRPPAPSAPLTVMARIAVERAKPLDTPVLTMDHPGMQELLLQFTPASPAVAPRAFTSARAATGGVAAKSSPPPPLSQTIVLRYR